jgi:3-phosphoshikimate 1-carboxyvinyltransferase
MKPFAIRPARCPLKGRVDLPGDKSIAHRAVILSALSSGKTSLENFPSNEDCLVTLKAFRQMGIKSNLKKSKVIIYGKGLLGLNKPPGPIYLSESGTSFRLLLGVLAGQNFPVTLTAARSLSQRPMARVTVPLRIMGALIRSKIKVQNSKTEEFAPITIKGGDLNGITYKMPVASAQVKSAILLAGLYARGKTHVIETVVTRDHTERMLKVFQGRSLRSPGNIYIPGDISSAAFLIVAATIIAGSRILIKNISLNPTRVGAIKVLRRMGGDIKVKSQRLKVKGGEPIGDITVKFARLKGVKIKKEEIPSLIDELPVLMVAASLAKGGSIFEGVGELRVKETDRIRSMVENLKKMGADIKVEKINGQESIIIEGIKMLRGTRVKSFGDHRTAMSMIVSGLAAAGTTRINDVSCISKSFPDFIKVINSLKK